MSTSNWDFYYILPITAAPKKAAPAEGAAAPAPKVKKAAAPKKSK